MGARGGLNYPLEVATCSVISLVLAFLLIFPTLSKCQEVSSGFKASTGNVDKNRSEDGAGSAGKAVDFITGNPNQRSVPNNSQSYGDLYTRGLGNYVGGGGTSISNGQLGYFPPSYGPFGGGPGGSAIQQGPPFGGAKGPQYPSGPFPFPLGQFPGFHQPPGGIGKPPFPHHQFPLNPNGQLGPMGTGPGGYFPQGFGGGQGLPSGQGYPYPGGAGNLFLGFPKQIRVPGRIEISLSGNDAEIICEFPRFLILIQKVYWHHKYEDPYGTFYDTSNRFGPRVTVITPDKWKSVIHIRNYNEDDFGTYRCLAAAILPDEGSSPYQAQQHRGDHLLRSPSTTTEKSETSLVSSLEHQHYLTTPLSAKSKSRDGKEMKFPSSRSRVRRRIRFSPTTIIPDIAHGPRDYNRIEGVDENKVGTHLLHHLSPGSQDVYDPYYYQNHDDQEGPTTRNYFHHHISGGGPFSTSTLGGVGSHGNHLQHSTYNGIAGNGGYGGFSHFQQPGGSSGGTGYGPYAPFYKPSYGIFTIFQEIKFTHPQIRGRANTSPTTNIINHI